MDTPNVQIDLDELPVSSLPNRYGVHRSQVYNRMDALKKLDERLVPFKQGRKSYVSAELLGHLDSMNVLLKENGTTVEQAANRALGRIPTRLPDSPVDIGQSALTYSPPGELVEPETEQEIDPEFNFEDLLGKLRGLQELADKGWWLSTSQIANVLELKSLPGGPSFERYGFRFVRAGKNGAETAWKIEKLD